MNIYYRIWVDGIIQLKSRPQNAGLWKFFAMIFTSMAMAFNLLFILFLLSDLGITNGIFKVHVNLFSSYHFNTFLSFFVTYLLPFIMLNYFLIFYKDRYKKLLKNYPSYQGKLYLKYFLSSFLIFLIYIIFAILIAK